MLSIQNTLSRTISLSRLRYFGICKGYKYLHSASKEVQRNDNFSACSQKCESLEFINPTLHKSQLMKMSVLSPLPRLTQLAQMQQLDLSHFISGSQKEIKLPISSTVSVFNLPPLKHVIERNDEPQHYIEAPPHGGLFEKRAARLIVIRRRKMKKHKLKKLRKKMKYEWAKVRQRREMKKEKVFQAELISQIKQAEKFDAEEYVQERLQKFHDVQLPPTFKGNNYHSS